MNMSTSFGDTNLFYRNVLEELSIRADYSLCQKKVMNEISSAEANFEEEYVALSAQVVSARILPMNSPLVGDLM